MVMDFVVVHNKSTSSFFVRWTKAPLSGSSVSLLRTLLLGIRGVEDVLINRYSAEVRFAEHVLSSYITFSAETEILALLVEQGETLVFDHP